MLQRSLSLRILLVNFILLILPLLLYFFIIFKTQYSGEIIEAAQELKGLADSRSALFSEMVQDGFVSLNLIKKLLNATSTTLSDNKEINEKLKNLAIAGGYSEINYFHLTEEGDFIVSASSNLDKIGKNYDFRIYLHETEKLGQAAYLAVHTNSNNKELFLSEAVMNDEKQTPVVKGVITTVTPAFEVLHRLVNTEYTPFNARVSILTKDGIVFVSSDPKFELSAIYPISIETLRSLEMDEEFGSNLIQIKSNQYNPLPGVPNAYSWQDESGERIGIAAPVEGTNFSLFIDCKKSTITEGFYRHLWQLITIISLMAIITTLLNLWLTSRISNPLKHLFFVMNELSKGNLQISYKKDPFGYEINKIGLTLNQMVENIKANMEKMKNEKESRELLAKELTIGREIQMSILPYEMPSFDGVEVAAKSLPALEVGGDFYDLYVCESQNLKRLVVTIGDGAGKGISACLYSLCLRSILRSYASEFLSVGDFMKYANNLFYLDTERTSMFATAASMILDEKERKIHFCSAGHPCMIRRKNGFIEKLSPLTMAMGVMQTDEGYEKEIEMESGDLILFYSDGASEAQNQEGKLYGEERLANFLSIYGTLPPKMLLDDIYKDIDQFCEGAKQWDDITIVIVRIL